MPQSSDSTQPLPLSAILDAATPGPWPIEYDNADDRGGGQWYDVGPAKVWWPYGDGRAARERAEANAQLIARANPETMRAVLKHITIIEQLAGTIIIPPSKSVSAVERASNIRAVAKYALALLNGQNLP